MDSLLSLTAAAEMDMHNWHDGLRQYMRDIQRYPLLTREEEGALAARVAAGDRHARDQLILSNLRLVVKIAHDYRGRGVPLADLISEGNAGLARAAEMFDPRKGAKLSSYASWWIKQAMRRALNNHGRTIRIPSETSARVSKLLSCRERLRDELGRDPTHAELAAATQLSERTVRALLLAKGVTAVSLQDSVQSDDARQFSELIPDLHAPAPDETAAQRETMSHVLSMLEQLDERERIILKRRYGLHGSDPQTLDQISPVVGLTSERIRQLQKKALQRLSYMLATDTTPQHQHARRQARIENGVLPNGEIHGVG